MKSLLAPLALIPGAVLLNSCEITPRTLASVGAPPYGMHRDAFAPLSTYRPALPPGTVAYVEAPVIDYGNPPEWTVVQYH